MKKKEKNNNEDFHTVMDGMRLPPACWALARFRYASYAYSVGTQPWRDSPHQHLAYLEEALCDERNTFV